jgi:predicted enzyme related to lactoylglutathione lyase
VGNHFLGLTEHPLVQDLTRRRTGHKGGLPPQWGPGPLVGQAVNSYVGTVSTVSVNDHVQKTIASGGTVALQKTPIPGVGWLTYCKDTEGNFFALMQSDPKAA